MNIAGHWTSSHELTAVAARHLLDGHDPDDVVEFLERHANAVEVDE